LSSLLLTSLSMFETLNVSCDFCFTWAHTKSVGLYWQWYAGNHMTSCSLLLACHYTSCCFVFFLKGCTHCQSSDFVWEGKKYIPLWCSYSLTSCFLLGSLGILFIVTEWQFAFPIIYIALL
jgi:hypothetical protein